MGWDSVTLIGRVRGRFNELIEKCWDWRSFYGGWMEGRADMLEKIIEDDSKLDSAIQLIKDIAHMNYYGDVADFANRWLKEHGYGDEK